MPDPTPARPDLLAGTPYRVLGTVGVGGMGTVLEAEHRALGKRVVVKLLLPKYAEEPRLVERLKREARILGHIASPYIVTVTDLGQTAGGATYLVMERLYGHTLGRELKARGALPVPEAIAWTRQILAGLHAAHRAGVVHRDVKLDNVFLCDATEQEPRRIKLLDFGIAKVLKEAMAGMDLSRHQPTAEGTLLGSPRWLAPEQACGKAVDARTDVYAVGLLLYTLIAGRGPFSHVPDPIEAIQVSLREQPAPPSRLAPQHIPAALDDAILMAIEKDPEHRFQTAEAFSTALDTIATELGNATQELPAGPVWRRIEIMPTDEPTTQPAARESNAPTLVHHPAPRSAPLQASGAEGRGLRVVPFVALTAATTLLFSALLALLAHFAGGH